MNKHNLIIEVFVLFLIMNWTNILFGQIAEWETTLQKDPKNREILLKIGKYYHNLGGNQRDKESVKKAEKYLARLLEIEPRNGEALVYYGSVLTMKARDAFFPWTQMKLIKLGFARMDKAVFLEPDNPEIRLIRGINSASVPDRFHRLSVALDDFKHIEELHRKKGLKMTNKFWLPYYYNYGLALFKSNELGAAKEKFIKAIEIAPGSDYALKAKQKLAAIKGGL